MEEESVFLHLHPYWLRSAFQLLLHAWNRISSGRHFLPWFQLSAKNNLFLSFRPIHPFLFNPKKVLKKFYKPRAPHSHFPLLSRALSLSLFPLSLARTKMVWGRKTEGIKSKNMKLDLRWMWKRANTFLSPCNQREREREEERKRGRERERKREKKGEWKSEGERTKRKGKNRAPFE